MSEIKKRIVRRRSCSVSYKKDPMARIRGAQNKAMGQRFEEYISDSLAYYERTGVASVEKTPEPMRPIKNLGNGKFIAFFESVAQPDYKGVLRGGRAVVFEAKHTITGKLESGCVTKKQAERMEKYSSLGAECFVLAGFSDCVYRVPWDFWKNMEKAVGRKYVKPEDLEQYEVRIGWVGLQRIILIFD